MNLRDAKILAELLIEQHLTGVEYNGKPWTFAWNNRKRAFGVCSYKHSEIQLSRIMTATEDEAQVEDTILHEIAHALAGPGAGHGYQWKAMAMKIGATPRARASSSAETKKAIEPTWVMVFGTQIVRKYLRKPNRSTFAKVGRMWIPGNHDSLGKLELIPYAQYKRVAG